MIKLLIGNIASGKSTYCKSRARNGALIINDDSIVNGIHCNQYNLYNEGLKPLYKSIENQILMMGIAMNREIVVDRGLNLTPKSRRRFIGLAHSLDVAIDAIVFKFENPELHAKRRQEHDLRGHSYKYWLEVAEIFDKKYVEPTLEEGFNSIVEITQKDIEVFLNASKDY